MLAEKPRDIIVNEKCCVLIAFKDRLGSLLVCLERLLPQLSATQHLFLVDDGSREDITQNSLFKNYLDNPSIFITQHNENRGVSAARNTGVRWALDNDYDILIMTDSDCLISDSFIDDHLKAHRKYPKIPMVCGAVKGKGHTLWARLDNLMTWFHCFPGTPEGIIPHPYIAPTANISLKIRMLPFKLDFFNESLRTGEDTAFSRMIRNAGFSIVFSPSPEIGHHDRNRFGEFIKHQYEFGRHHYVILHLDFHIGQIYLHPMYRFLFVPAFFLVLPFYSVLGSALNIIPWMRHDSSNVIYWPLMQLVWLLKGVGVLESACFPRRVFRDNKLSSTLK